MVDELTSFLIYCSLIVLHYIYIPLSYHLVHSANQIWFSFVVVLFRRLLFDRVTVCCLYCRWGAKKLAVGGKRVLQQQRKIEKNCDEELLILVFQYRKKIRGVLNGGVSASWMK